MADSALKRMEDYVSGDLPGLGAGNNSYVFQNWNDDKTVAYFMGPKFPFQMTANALMQGELEMLKQKIKNAHNTEGRRVLGLRRRSSDGAPAAAAQPAQVCCRLERTCRFVLFCASFATSAYLL